MSRRCAFGVVRFDGRCAFRLVFIGRFCAVFDAEIIELCVCWYITYRLSYRDLIGMMAERGVMVAHSTILRGVTRYVPEYERRWNRFSRPVGTSWRTDET